MGKKIIISGVDFSANAIPIAKAVKGTTSPQYVYVANVENPSAGFDWDAHKVEVQISSDGSIVNFNNLPSNTVALPYFFTGSADSNGWIKEIDLSYLSSYPLTSIRTMLGKCISLERVVIGGSFLSLSGNEAAKYLVFNSTIDEIVIDKTFHAPNLSNINFMFYGAKAKSMKGLMNLIKPSVQNASYLFYDCNRLKELDLTGCDTSNISDFSHMFRNCRNLERIIGINELDTSGVSDYTQMFSDCGCFGTLNISNWSIAANAKTERMFYSAKVYDLNANCFTALYGNVSGMFYLETWNTIHLDNLNDVSAVTQSTDFFGSYVTGTPKVTIANVTNSAVKTFLINALNARSVGGSSNWHEDTVDGVLCLVP